MPATPAEKAAAIRAHLPERAKESQAAAVAGALLDEGDCFVSLSQPGLVIEKVNGKYQVIDAVDIDKL